MKRYSLYLFAASLFVTCAAGFAQTPSEVDSHIAAAKAAAGLNFRDTFVNLCLPGAGPGGARGRRATRRRRVLQAVSNVSTGQIVLQNPKPGTRGSLGLATMELPGNWSFDASMSKSVRVKEGKTLQLRFDSTNVFNHPVPSTPILNINGTTPFGSIQDKGAQRRFFKGSVRLNF